MCITDFLCCTLYSIDNYSHYLYWLRRRFRHCLQVVHEAVIVQLHSTRDDVPRPHVTSRALWLDVGIKSSLKDSKSCPKSSCSFNLKVMFSIWPNNRQVFWIICWPKNFQKLPNLVTLVTCQALTRALSLFAQPFCKELFGRRSNLVKESRLVHTYLVKCIRLGCI